jgi:hypothetical protein
MFSVENADFIADKLASELLPYQEYREAFKNGEEAVARRMEADGSETGGRVEFDVDWPLLAQTGAWYISCADNGDGMTHVELDRYMTTLAVQGAGRNQGLAANQGMGLKISGPTRHKRGLIIRSLKNTEAWMVQIGWTGTEYGLIPIGPEDEVVMRVPPEMFPEFIQQQGSGTVVTLLGNEDGENTFAPAGRPKGWLMKYLNQRLFRISGTVLEVVSRVPTGEIDEWPRTREEASRRRAKSFNLTKVNGTAEIWDEAADKQGDGFHGVEELPGDAASDIPSARMHWWVLPTGPGADVSTRTTSGGSIAVLFQNELHDWRTTGQANPFFARLGVLFGKTRIAFILEPVGGTVTSDFARAHVLVGGRPVFESDAWLTWSEQFRARLPEVIQRTIAEEQARLQAEDPDRARRIRDRLKDVMQLLRPRRWRQADGGEVRAGGPSATGPDGGQGDAMVIRIGAHKRKASGGARGIGAVLTQVDPDGEAATEVYSMLHLEPRWVTEREAEDFALVNANGTGLKDRAAGLAGEDGATASLLLLNRDFRGYQTILAAVNEWANPDGDDAKADIIQAATQEWVEQKLVEAVTGLRQLENGSTWRATYFDDAFSPVALTAAFMADRYHTLREVKRQVGAIRRGNGAPPANEATQ